MSAVRSFEFPDDTDGRPVERWEALAAIRAALDDEGLTLAPTGSRLRIVTMIRQPDAMLCLVPVLAIVGRDWPRP